VPFAFLVVKSKMTTTYSLKNFIDDLDRITRTESSQEKIVNAAKPLLVRLVQQPDCIEPKYRKRGATAYGRYMLHRAPLFNISSVVWGPGDNAKAHNHDTWGMVGVIENEIQETRFRRKDDGARADRADLEVTAVLKNKAGMVSCLVSPNDDIHEMNNVSDRDTLEIHVYGKDLTDMPRLRFDIASKTAKTFASPKYDNC
jgi:predicted metal-dependent enzyme (double-stranded beta helix superfamily)